MARIKNVAIVGATGNLGPHIVRALLDADFNITAITRASSSSTPLANISVRRADFSSKESLIAALEGQDAVVSTVGTLAVPSQLLLIDAAIAARVKRFIPSEFGVDARLVANSKLAPLLAGKMKVIDYLREKTQENTDFSWTALAAGSFFQFGLINGGFGFDMREKSATIFDSGHALFSPSSFELVGAAVAAVFARYEKTANQYLAIASLTTSQAELLKVLKEETSADWQVKHISTTELETSGVKRLGEKNPAGVLDLMKAFQFADQPTSNTTHEVIANDLFGLKEDDLRSLVRATLETV